MIATNASRPRSRSYKVAHRIADRFGPTIAASFVRAVGRLKAGITEAELMSAIASGNTRVIESAIGATRLSALFAGGESLSDLLDRTAKASGAANADLVSGATGAPFAFDFVRPGTVLYARARAAALVVQITDDVREAIQVVTAAGALEGLTVQQQARAIREVVGLPPNWAAAPSNLARELRGGRFTSSRRLSAIDKARIRKRLREGTVDEAFVAEMQARYSSSLVNRRAQNIARTESLAASHFGQREAWTQGVEEGVLPGDARRMFVVTPDDRLRETHAMVPGMNPNGVGLDEPFDTPMGPIMDPPLETNCRCGVGLIFPGTGGVL